MIVKRSGAPLWGPLTSIASLWGLECSTYPREVVLYIMIYVCSSCALGRSWVSAGLYRA